MAAVNRSTLWLRTPGHLRPGIDEWATTGRHAGRRPPPRRSIRKLGDDLLAVAVPGGRRSELGGFQGCWCHCAERRDAGALAPTAGFFTRDCPRRILATFCRSRLLNRSAHRYKGRASDLTTASPPGPGFAEGWLVDGEACRPVDAISAGMAVARIRR
jgi:hypothetical protein